MKILAILVLYNCKIEDSKTLNSLIENYHKYPSIVSFLKLLIYDNGLIYQKNNIEVPFNYEYVQNRNNEGLSVAYNYALINATNENLGWLLLLDQDSSLPENFIINLSNDLFNVEKDLSIIAVVPKMCYKGYFFSPSKVLYGGIHRPINMMINGIFPNEIFAIGSCSVVRTTFFQNIGGFNDFFWLDCLDRWIYLVIFRSGGKVFVTNSIVEHELSVMEYSKLVNEKRYYNIMIYETYFMSLYKSKTENFIYYLRLLKRIFSFSLSRKTQKFSKITIKHLISILLNSNKIPNIDKLNKSMINGYKY